MSPRKRDAYHISDVDPSTFGAQLRHYRMAAGLSQEELGEITGIGQARMSSYERGVNDPSEDVIIKLAEALNINPSAFYEAARFNNVLVVGPELREKLRRLDARQLRMLDHFLAAIDNDDPQVREQLERGLRAFLDSPDMNGV